MNIFVCFTCSTANCSIEFTAPFQCAPPLSPTPQPTSIAPTFPPTLQPVYFRTLAPSSGPPTPPAVYPSFILRTLSPTIGSYPSSPSSAFVRTLTPTSRPPTLIPTNVPTQQPTLAPTAVPSLITTSPSKQGCLCTNCTKSPTMGVYGNCYYLPANCSNSTRAYISGLQAKSTDNSTFTVATTSSLSAGSANYAGATSRGPVSCYNQAPGYCGVVKFCLYFEH